MQEETGLGLKQISNAMEKAEQVYTAGKTIQRFLGKKKSPEWGLECNKATQKELLRIISLAEIAISKQDPNGNGTFEVMQGWCISGKRNHYVNLRPLLQANHNPLSFGYIFNKHGVPTEIHNVAASGAIESISRIILLTTHGLIVKMQLPNTRVKELLSDITTNICRVIEVKTKGGSIIESQYKRSWSKEKKKELIGLNEFMFDYHQMIQDLMVIADNPTLNELIMIVKSLEIISDILNQSYQTTSPHHINNAQQQEREQPKSPLPFLQRSSSFSRDFKIDNSFQEVFGTEHADKAIEILTLHGIRRHLASLFEEYANSNDELQHLENRIVRLLFTKYMCLHNQNQMIPNRITRASIFAQVLAILAGGIKNTQTTGNKNLRAILKHGLTGLSKLLNETVTRSTKAVSPADKSSNSEAEEAVHKSEYLTEQSANIATSTEAYHQMISYNHDEETTEPPSTVINKLLNAEHFLRRNPLDLYIKLDMQKSYLDLCISIAKITEIVQGSQISNENTNHFIVENIALMISLRKLLEHLNKHKQEKITGVSITEKENQIYKTIEDSIKLIEKNETPKKQEKSNEKKHNQTQEEKVPANNSKQSASQSVMASADESPSLSPATNKATANFDTQHTQIANEVNYATTIKYFNALSTGLEQTQFNSQSNKAFIVLIITESIITSLNQFLQHNYGDSETESKLSLREKITERLRDAGLLRGDGRFFSPKEIHKHTALHGSYDAHINQTR